MVFHHFYMTQRMYDACMNILSWRLSMKYFLRSFSSFCCFKKGCCQFLAKDVHNTVKSLRGLSLPSKNVAR